MSKKLLSITWILTILFCIYFSFSYPEYFEPKNIALFFNSFENQAIYIYLIASLIRGITLIPGTPFVVAGTLMFDNKPIVLAISMLGMIFSASMIYFFSNYLGFNKYFDKYENKIEKIREKLDSPNGFIFVILWSLFPFSPTDLICYVAGITKMRYYKFITALFIGELVICSAYVYSIKLFQF